MLEAMENSKSSQDCLCVYLKYQMKDVTNIDFGEQDIREYFDYYYIFFYIYSVHVRTRKLRIPGTPLI